MPGVAPRDSALEPNHHELGKEPDDNGKGKGKPGGGGGSSGVDSSDLHPFIQRLLKTLPAPEDENGKKKEWPVPQRVKWLQTAANIFDLIYEGEGGIEFVAAMATRSPRPGGQ